MALLFLELLKKVRAAGKKRGTILVFLPMYGGLRYLGVSLEGCTASIIPFLTSAVMPPFLAMLAPRYRNCLSLRLRYLFRSCCLLSLLHFLHSALFVALSFSFSFFVLDVAYNSVMIVVWCHLKNPSPWVLLWNSTGSQFFLPLPSSAWQAGPNEQEPLDLENALEIAHFCLL